LNDSGDTLTLFCVNRHLSRDISTAISISGFSASFDTSAQTLYAPSLYMKNDETNPEAIRPVETSVNAEAGKIEVTFRPASVTVIALRKSR
jgi:alpha-N-arabinofuranosidase